MQLTACWPTLYHVKALTPLFLPCPLLSPCRAAPPQDCVHKSNWSLWPELAGPTPSAHYRQWPLCQLLLPRQPGGLPLWLTWLALVARWVCVMQCTKLDWESYRWKNWKLIFFFRTCSNCLCQGGCSAFTWLPKRSPPVGHCCGEYVTTATAETTGAFP